MKLSTIRSVSVRLSFVFLAASAALTAGACQRGSMADTSIISSLGSPAATIENGSSVPVRITLWLGERGSDYNESWKNMTPRSELITAGGRTRLSLRDYDTYIDPVLRVQVETRGPSFLPSHASWHEIVTAPSFNLRLFGRPEDLQLRSTNARLVRIPNEKVLSTVRGAVATGADNADSASDPR
ncbi:MAG: hypothetical protein EA376_02230 [Phycisphaeraceae bacterium]|nr:MAG: hypothetical protein EA376_02230 [Phycisphaeraceae bacterium]